MPLRISPRSWSFVVAPNLDRKQLGRAQNKLSILAAEAVSWSYHRRKPVVTLTMNAEYMAVAKQAVSITVPIPRCPASAMNSALYQVQ
jgi:hypothetical protein